MKRVRFYLSSPSNISFKISDEYEFENDDTDADIESWWADWRDEQLEGGWEVVA